MSSPSPAALSHQLREGSGSLLQYRRGVVASSLVAAGSMGLIALYQIGVIKRLPDPPLPYFNSEKVDASGDAYAYFSTPDAFIGFVNYGVTMLLAAAGGPERAREQPWLPLGLAVKAAIDAAQAGKLTVDQWTQHRAFCAWCLLAAGATFVTLPLTLPEARDALRAVTGR